MIPLASFPGSRAWEEEREPGTHCSRMRQVPLVTCILLRYTKITVTSVYLQKGSTAWLYSFWDPYGRFLSQKQYRFDGNCVHCFVRSDRWTSKEDIASVTCCKDKEEAAVFSWNAQTRGQFLQTKSWVPFSLLRHRPHGAWSVTAIFYTEKSAYLTEVSVTEQILRKISKFPEILGELSMRKQCLPGSFSSAHALEPGNEAKWELAQWHYATE